MALASIGVATLWACATPDFAQFSCGIPCGTSCPSPLECRDGWCVLPGAPDCENRTGPATDDPALECRSADGLHIQLATEPVSRVCTGAPIELSLAVDGGQPPYAWSFAGLDGWDLGSREPTPTSSISVRGEFETTGPREVTIEVRAGEGEDCERSSLSLPFEVVAAPEITTTSLGEACIGVTYAQRLGWVSRDVEEHRLEVDGELPPGLRLEDGELVGTPSAEGLFAVDLRLEGGPCEPLRRRLMLMVRAASECPRVQTNALAAPCEGVPYEQAVSALNGQPPYSWGLVDGPSWLSIETGTAGAGTAAGGTAAGGTADTGAAILRGTPGGEGGSATVEVRDAAGHVNRRSYSLAPRQSCHLAFLSEASGSTSLHYTDVFGTRDVEVSGELAAGSRVLDFEFSPDGDRLAFRAERDGASTLYLYALSGGEGSAAAGALAVPFECPSGDAGASAATCSVLDYAWSGDSRQLAVVLGAEGLLQNSLSGVDLVALDRPWPAVAAEYRQQLRWIGSEAVAFSGGRAGFDGLQLPSVAPFDADGGRFAEPIAASVPASAWTLRATPSGAFFFDGNVDLVHFALLPEPTIEVHPTGWLSPSGRVAAAANAEGRLRLTAVGAPSVVLAESEPGQCEVVFAWAERREIIACVQAQSTALGTPPDPQPIPGLPFSHGSRLRIFAFDADAPPGQRLTSWLVPPERYFEVTTAGRRRAFSPDGSWLVFLGQDAGGEEFVQTVSTTPELTSGFSTGFADGDTAVELGVSPTGDALVTYGSRVYRRAAPDRSAGADPVADDLEPPFVAAEPGPCAEELYANPERWCGGPAVPNRFRFSPDGTGLLLEDASGGLALSDLSRDPIGARATAARLPRCTTDCSKRPVYAFRPHL